MAVKDLKIIYSPGHKPQGRGKENHWLKEKKTKTTHVNKLKLPISKNVGEKNFYSGAKENRKNNKESMKSHIC